MRENRVFYMSDVNLFIYFKVTIWIFLVELGLKISSEKHKRKRP